MRPFPARASHAALVAGLLLAGCGGGSGATPNASVTVVSAPTAVVTPTPSPTPTATPTPASTTAGTATTTQAAAPKAPTTALSPLDLSDMRLWNYAGKWHASEWSNSMSPLPWKFDHVSQPKAGDTYFTLDANGAPELQGVGGTPAATRGLWEADVTLPQLRSGLVVAPLWLYDQTSRDEVDFEFAGRNGLDVSLHVYVDGQHKQSTTRLFAGQDMSGQRHRFGIRMDQAAGVIEMYVDGQRVHRWDRATTGFFVSRPLKPFIEMWAGNDYFAPWLGAWTPLGVSEKLTMTVHGYGYSAEG